VDYCKRGVDRNRQQAPERVSWLELYVILRPPREERSYHVGDSREVVLGQREAVVFVSRSRNAGDSAPNRLCPGEMSRTRAKIISGGDSGRDRSDAAREKRAETKSRDRSNARSAHVHEVSQHAWRRMSR